MLLIISLIIVSLFIYFLKDSLKKNPNVFYIGAAVISIAVFALGFVDFPIWVKQNILGIFAKGSIGTAMFVFVMYAGALPKGSKFIAPLMRIRGELSITAAILVLCHNATYGMTYFKMLFTAPAALSTTQLTAAVVSIILIVLMLVLTVTSFPSVRKKMQPKMWKQLQRSAYVFYGLMYVHIMLINVPLARNGVASYVINVVVYSVVFVVYAAMRINKYLVKTGRNNLNVTVNIAAAVIIVCMSGLCFAGNSAAGSDSDMDVTGSGSNASENGSAASGSTTFKADGTYTGTATCETYGYKVTVVMIVKDDKITEVTATSEAGRQDSVYFDMANESVPEQIVENQGSKGVDSVSGATLSSKAIKVAFYNAYKSALK